MRHADGVLIGNPAHAVAAAFIAVALRAAAEADEAGLIWLGDLPGPATLEPFVGDLHLPAVADQLVEDAELVADAVAGGRDLERGERFHEAGGQPPQTAVAEAGLLLHLENLLEVVDAEALQGFSGSLLDAEHQQVVAQLGADQEFGREVGHHAGRGRTDRFDARQIAGHQPVAHRMAQGQVEIVAAGCRGELAERVEEVLGHAVEHVIGAEAAAVGVGVAAGGRQLQGAGAVFLHRTGSRFSVQLLILPHCHWVTSGASMPCSWA